MKFNIEWLRQWVNISGLPEELSQQLTQIGLEVEGIEAGIVDLSVPPNRGDCLSIMGVARELAVLNRSQIKTAPMEPISPVINDVLPIKVEDGCACPQYLGRIIKNINTSAKTPEWMQQVLTTAGISSISAVVDIANYVMLELGQPMHTFDLSTITKEIIVRKALAEEKLVLLDNTEINLQHTDLVITDQHKVLALAGIMGGKASSVMADSKDILLESAYFEPVGIRLTARHHKLTTDSAYRFERSVDPDLQIKALNRATSLLQEIVGGQPGPVITVTDKLYMPAACSLLLRKERIKKVLSICPVDSEILEILTRLGMECLPNDVGWSVIVPTYRQDITREIDLIEEVARFIGYQNIPAIMPTGTLDFKQHSETHTSEFMIKSCLSSRGYAEVITYSFIAPEVAELFEPKQEYLKLINPISADMSVMRTSLLPGLTKVLQYNAYRQCNRVRIFEIGLKFITNSKQGLQQEKVLAGLCVGDVHPEHWDLKSKTQDFFDSKGDIEALAKLSRLGALRYEPSDHPALHPGRSAAIYRENQYIGYLGELHPQILKVLDLTIPVVVFELNFQALTTGTISKFCCLSKFPGIRRDLAIIVAAHTLAQDIENVVRASIGDLLQGFCLFDVYCGKGVEPGKKSIGIGMVLQHPSRTLVDDEIKTTIEKVIAELKAKLNAILR